MKYMHFPAAYFPSATENDFLWQCKETDMSHARELMYFVVDMIDLGTSGVNIVVSPN
jgi:hypothetical protein